MGQTKSGSRTSFMACAAAVVTLSVVTHSFGKTDVPVFLLSGQSNMAGYCFSESGLSAEDKEDVDNVKIYIEGDGAQNKKGKWLTLGMKFDAMGMTLGPELSFGRTLSDSMPDTKIALIKSSVGGTYLGKSEDWLPPSSNNGNGGRLYNNMMGHIDAALRSFNSAFDTSLYVPQWAGFVWFQGEFDAYDLQYANVYEQNLTNLINDIREHVEVDDLPVIIPMIDVQSQWTHNGVVRTADITVSQNMENVDTVDTKGLPTDGTHYRADGYITIGKRCAERWLAMDFDYGEKVPVVHFSGSAGVRGNSLDFYAPAVTVFDLAGRRIGSCEGNALLGSAPLQLRTNGCAVTVRGRFAGSYCNVR